ncbi:MAG: helix-turn-helix transcriptional regulator [Bacteroidota bacterium]
MNTQNFIQQASCIVKKQLSAQNDIDVACLAKELDIHPAHLYRKMKAALDISPSVFIRSIRLEKATDLLLHSSLEVQQIAYQVGFGSSSYFILCFKEKFGKTPMEYRTHAI